MRLFLRTRALAFFLALASSLLSGAALAHDLVIRNGTVYDGSGQPPVKADIAVDGDTIARIGKLSDAKGKVELDASGFAVAPGFINMLSWATETLLVDGRSQSDIRQGVTLEVFGEGKSMGPLNDTMKQEMRERQGDLHFDIGWTTLGEYLEHLVRRGVSPNVGSFVGATTVRIHEIGHADRPPTPGELARMENLVSQAMEEGALGLGSALIYAPAFYARAEELTALSRAAARYGGIYISHLRSEGARFLEALDELIQIARDAGIPAEVYHFKAAGRPNWDKVDAAIKKIEAARADGLRVTANMYTYTAAATGLDAAMPPWVQEGGNKAWAQRLRDPAIRARVKEEMRTPTDQWENFYVAAGSPENIIAIGLQNQRLKPLIGKTLAEIAKQWDCSPEDAAMDLVIQDDSRVESAYFLMSEDNIRKQLRLPWMSFASDAPSLAPEGAFLRSNPHPRAYGNVARLLGRYVRDERVIPLAEAIRRLTSLPANNLRLDRRGALKEGYFADIVVFDPAAIQDHATYDQPHQYSTGVRQVFVNGTPVLKDGEHTGATPGRILRGPGWKRFRQTADP
ncbi:MAG: amidohydrolase family protein [Verrucomicrobiia bacterium]